MKHQILIVDDDDKFLDSLVSLFKKSQKIFNVIRASDGSEALNILTNTNISIVVSDVQMPVMDGFILMAYISSLYPDIPVIMMNDPGEIGAEEAALESGAIAYMEKPFTPGDLLHTISDTIKKMSDGGQLSNVSLEMFIQLFEMEMKTCTVRVQDNATNNHGVLFFKDGELVNARMNDMEGNEAAFEIISWEKISVSISDTCIVREKLIDSDSQSIILEAARRKEKNRMNQVSINSNDLVDTHDRPEAEDMETPVEEFSGGKLTNVSLETFVQLFEMEEKTCMLTVENPRNHQKGILYFKDGDLMDAKLNYITGNEAALKILSWEKVSVDIGYDVELMEKRIEGDLQGMLLESMRLRDEVNMSEDDFREDKFTGKTGRMNNQNDIIMLSEEQIIPPAKMSEKQDSKPIAGEGEETGKKTLVRDLKKIWSKLTK